MFGREFLKDGSLINRIENDPTILEYITPQNVNTNEIINNTNNTIKQQTNQRTQVNQVKENNTVKQTTTNQTKPKTSSLLANNTNAAKTATQQNTAVKPQTNTVTKVQTNTAAQNTNNNVINNTVEKDTADNEDVVKNTEQTNNSDIYSVGK